MQILDKSQVYIITSKYITVSSVVQLCPTLCNPMDCSMPGLSVHHQFPELTQINVHQVNDFEILIFVVNSFLNSRFIYPTDNLVSFRHSVQFSSVSQSCPTLCGLMDHSTPGLPVYHQLPESTQAPLHWVSDAIQPSHPLSSPSPPAFNFSQHQGLFQWVSSSHQVVKVLEFQLQHQSFQWTPRTALL